MPNYITVRVAMLAEDMERNALNEKGEFDLDAIRPMPDDLNLPKGSFQMLAVRAAQAIDGNDEAALKEIEAEADRQLPHVVYDTEYRTIEDLYALGKLYLRNETLYGAQTWYEWRVEQWGTKWNALDPKTVEAGDLKIACFQTAWDAPCKELMEVLALRSTAPVWMEWADDDDYNGIRTSLSTKEGTLEGMAPLMLEETVVIEGDEGAEEAWCMATDGAWQTDKLATVLHALKGA